MISLKDEALGEEESRPGPRVNPQNHKYFMIISYYELELES